MTNETLESDNSEKSREFISLTSAQLDELKNSQEIPAAQAKILESMGNEALHQLGKGELIGVVQSETLEGKPKFYKFEGSDVGTHIRDDSALANEYNEKAQVNETPQGTAPEALKSVEDDEMSPPKIEGLKRYERIVTILQELAAPSDLQQLEGEFERVKSGVYVPPGEFDSLLSRVEATLMRKATLAESALHEFNQQAPEMETDVRRGNEQEAYDQARQFVGAYDELRMNVTDLGVVRQVASDGNLRAMRSGNYNQGLVVNFVQSLHDSNAAIGRIKNRVEQLTQIIK